jgi:hypothetical protein
MYLSLVKKDFAIVLRGNIAILLAQLLFILIIISLNMGVIGYGVMATAFGWQILMSVSAKEKENNCLGLLIAMPYERNKIITSRYVSAILGFLAMTVIYEIIAVFANVIFAGLFKMLTPEIFLVTMCSYVLFISITLPLYFKFDDTVVRGISLFMIMAVTMGGFLLWRVISINLNRIMEIVFNNIELITICVMILSLWVSRNITLSMFKKMEF